MVECLEDLSERTVAQSAHYLVSIAHRIPRSDSSLTVAVGEILGLVDPPRTNIQNLVAQNLLLLKLC